MVNDDEERQRCFYSGPLFSYHFQRCNPVQSGVENSERIIATHVTAASTLSTTAKDKIERSKKRR